LLDFQVDFALLLYDEFNGFAITDASVLFYHEGRILTPLRKREGFYVFRGLGIPEIDIEIRRPHYHPAHKRILKSCLDPGYPVEKVRLMRQHPGTFSDCDWFHGNAPPEREVLAFAGEELKAGVGEERNRITILGQSAGRLLGRRFAPEKGKGETFLLTSLLAPGIYQADKELPASKKGAFSIVRAYLSRSGSDGWYHIPVEYGHSENITATAYDEGGRGKWVYASATVRS
jgi:hypothetical protein